MTLLLSRREISRLLDLSEGADKLVAACNTVDTTTQPQRVGTHAVGADEPSECELEGALLEAARVVVDDHGLATIVGALATVGLDAAAIIATLADVLAGHTPARTDDSEITVFASVGVARQDLALLWPIYERARGEGVRTSIDLGGAPVGFSA